ncbi:hypothetical protein A9Y87_13875 [Salmonella enterica subsp. enterica]|nr:hypothetical protein A9Y87_13875 [Salmonella enterica subsp. enterica]
MNKNVKLSLIAIAVSLFMAKQASAANTWTEARNDAMGGTGVASLFHSNSSPLSGKAWRRNYFT